MHPEHAHDLLRQENRSAAAPGHRPPRRPSRAAAVLARLGRSAAGLTTRGRTTRGRTAPPAGRAAEPR